MNLFLAGSLCPRIWFFEEERNGNTQCAKKRQVPKIVDIGPELRLAIEALLNQGVGTQQSLPRASVYAHLVGEHVEFTAKQPI